MNREDVEKFIGGNLAIILMFFISILGYSVIAALITKITARDLGLFTKFMYDNHILIIAISLSLALIIAWIATTILKKRKKGAVE